MIIHLIFSQITIETINEFLTAENAEQIVQGATVVVDASDNAQTR